MRQTSKDPLAVQSTGYRHCPLCGYVHRSIDAIREHLTDAHHVFSRREEAKAQSEAKE